MSYKFREWPIYKDAREFRKGLKAEVIAKIPLHNDLRRQIERAANSILLNIAEGAYRKSDRDTAHFLNQADTSLNEVVSCLDLCLDDGFIDAVLHEIYLKRSNGLIIQFIGFKKHLLKDS